MNSENTAQIKINCESLLDASKSLDKTVLTVASGAFVLSITG